MPVLASAAAFFLVAFPVIVLMTIWSVVMMGRILFPERPLPFDAAARRAAARRKGHAVPVRLADILDDQRRQRAQQAAVAETDSTEPSPTQAEAPHGHEHPFFADLWDRRN